MTKWKCPDSNSNLVRTTNDTKSKGHAKGLIAAGVASIIITATIAYTAQGNKKIVLKPITNVSQNQLQGFQSTIDERKVIEGNLPLLLSDSINLENDLNPTQKIIFKQVDMIENLTYEVDGKDVSTLVSAKIIYSFNTSDIVKEIQNDPAKTGVKIIVITPDFSKITTEVTIKDMDTGMEFPSMDVYSAFEKKVEKDLADMYLMPKEDVVTSLVDFFRNEFKFLASEYNIAVNAASTPTLQEGEKKK